MNKSDNFLADATRAARPKVGYVDGFRFGIGFFVAGLLMLLIVGGLTYAAITFGHLH